MSCWKYSDVDSRSSPCHSCDRRVTRVDTCGGGAAGGTVLSTTGSTSRWFHGGHRSWLQVQA